MRKDFRRAPMRSLAAVLAGVLTLLAGCGGDTGPSPVDDAFLTDLAAFTGLPRAPRGGASEAFWAHWGDGRAELSGYRATVTRYGAPREAELSLVYVTEPHDRRTWIKDDRAEGANRVEVLKLLRSEHFLTGIYPYSVMTGVFAPVEDWGVERFHPVRLNLDVQEWCGSVAERLWPGPGRVRALRLSYFDWEGETYTELDIPQGTVFEDALLVQLRELDGPFAGGGDWEGWLHPELWRLRSRGADREPIRATITRDEGERAGVPITRFRLEAGDYWRVYEVERASPRRVLAWETSTGDTAELLSTERLAYWSLNAPGDERYRAELGLSPFGLLPPGNVGAACAVDPAGAGGS